MKKIRVLEYGVSDSEKFFEILLEEKYLDSEISVPKALLKSVGGVNDKLRAKQNYELLLRITAGNQVEISEQEEAYESADETGNVLLEFAEARDVFENLRTDCYVAGKYKKELMDAKCFEPAIESILQAAEQAGVGQEIVPWLEQMIGQGEAYYKIDDATRPILIYKGSDICHNVLNVFAEKFGEALEQAGCPVEYYTIKDDDVADISRLVGKRYRAVVGMQTYAFTIRMKDGEWLHNLIGGKKYNVIFDHPVWLKPHLEHRVKDFCVLTHDLNYVNYIKRYYGKQAALLPPAGIRQEEVNCTGKGRIYDLTFVGTYGDFMNEARLIHQMERKWRFLANRFLLKMRQNPNFPAEKALELVMIEQGEHWEDEEFLTNHYKLRRVVYCVMHYYRYRIVKAILDAGIRLDVFGDSWRKCPLAGYKNLICHPDVTVEESITIWRQSRLSLNVMSWHKAGFTERIANIMLAGAVVVTDQSDYLKAHFQDGREMITFDLEKIDELAERIRGLLLDEKECQAVAEQGYKVACEHHIWRVRADEFLKILLQ